MRPCPLLTTPRLRTTVTTLDYSRVLRPAEWRSGVGLLGTNPDPLMSALGARVRFLRQAGPDAKHFDAFRDGLREAGYSEGHNLIIEQRYAAGAYERLFGLTTELLSSNVDVIVVDGTAAAKACKDATTTVPIVFTLSVDPVADGLAASFAHPGGNLTGLTMAAGYGLAGKRVELLKDMVATLSRVKFGNLLLCEADGFRRVALQ